jgi:hypothetical protein
LVLWRWQRGALQHGITLVPLPDAQPREVVLVWRKTSPRAAVFEGIGKALMQTHALMGKGSLRCACAAR